MSCDGVMEACSVCETPEMQRNPGLASLASWLLRGPLDKGSSTSRQVAGLCSFSTSSDSIGTWQTDAVDKIIAQGLHGKTIRLETNTVALIYLVRTHSCLPSCGPSDDDTIAVLKSHVTVLRYLRGRLQPRRATVDDCNSNPQPQHTTPHTLDSK